MIYSEEQAARDRSEALAYRRPESSDFLAGDTLPHPLLVLDDVPEPEPLFEEPCMLDQLWDEYNATKRMPFERSNWRALAEDMGLGE